MNKSSARTTLLPPQPHSALRGMVAVAVAVALLLCQVLIGGTRLLFAFPAYALLGLAALSALFLFRGNKPRPDQLCLASALLFFGYILLRAFLSPVPALARFDIYSVVAGLIVYLLTATVLGDTKTRLLLLVFLLTAALGHVAVGALQFRNGDNWMPIAFLQRFDYGRRASGFYICPNHLAGLLEVVGLFGLSVAFWSRWPVWAKLLAGYAAMICYAGLVLTASRGGYLSALASLLVFTALSLRIGYAAGSSLQLRMGAGALVLAALAAVAIFLVIHQSDYLSDRTRRLIDQKNIRMDFWKAALQQWKLQPAVGTGSGTYLYYGRAFRTEAVQMDPVYVHNDYLQLLAEYGLIGGLFLLPFLGLHLRRGLITARRLGPRRISLAQRIPSHSMALNIGALGAVAAYAVHSFFDFNLHIPANVLLMAFVFGILANPGVDSENRPEPSAWRRILWPAIGTVLGLALLWQVVRLGPGEFYAEKARAALRDHRPLAGMSYALKGLEFERDNPVLYYYLGRSRFLGAETQRKEEARASFYRAALPAFEMARDLAPMDETYWLELAFTYDSLGRFEEAEWMFDEARRIDPRSQAVQRYYAAHLSRWSGHDPSSQGPMVPPAPRGKENG